MPPAIKKVETDQDKKKFIRLPWKIYKDQPLWVPPLLIERKRFLDATINPFFEHAEIDLFLAFSSAQEPVGRIALISDKSYNEFHSENIGFFGMFESINDQKTADSLLDTALSWCRSKGAAKLVGPVNLSTNHDCGLLIEGFENPPMIGIPYNPFYYSELLSNWGLVKAKDLLSFKIHPKKIPEYLERAVVKIKKRNTFKIRAFRLENYDKEIEKLWEIYNSAWSDNWGFVPMTWKEFRFAADEVKPILRPELCLLAEVDNEPAGFSLTLPNINQALKSMNGKLFPIGLVKFHFGKKKIDTLRVLTLGVKKKFQRSGIDAAFYHETYKRAIEQKITLIEMSWILEDNHQMTAPLHRMNAVIYKRHRIYERKFAN